MRSGGVVAVGVPPRIGTDTGRKRRVLRRIGTAFAVLGVAALAYAATVLLWRDPITDLYTRWQQRGLASALERQFAAYAEAAETSRAGRAGGRAWILEAARRFETDLRPGQPFGRLAIGTLGVEAVVVHGTGWAPELSKGPGHYPETRVPGLGKTVAIAGHRTTFGAPFRRLDKLRAGADVHLQMPYGAFSYRVFSRKIVANDDWSIIRPRGFDTLVLSACHPLYSAKQRLVVFARLVAVEPVSGALYTITRSGEAQPLPS
jgi:sortase A